MDKIVLYPNCKINIGLRVLSRREDGYHNLETLFYPVKGLCDTLEVHCAKCEVQREDCVIETEGIVVDCPIEDNLIYKCYRLMKAKYPEQVGPVRVRFRKRIPFGAGLGGGSSDAAHMAIALNELFSLGLSREELAHEVRVLGADCPYFCYNTPCYATGIGDELQEVEVDLSGYRLVMLKPHSSVSTREAYAGIVRHPEAEGQLLRHIQAYPTLLEGAYEEVLINDFEQTVFPLHEDIAHIKERLLAAGADYVAMSGSGSVVFALVKTDGEGSADAYTRLLDEELAAMVLLNDTLA